MVERARKTPKRHKAVRLAIFNHKGGVGKTTLTVNIANSLSDQGKRILLVDSDPQCNLTSYLVESAVLDDLLDHSDDDSGRTIWSAVKPIVEGYGQINIVEPLERYKNVYLLPGDIRLSDYEQELAQTWNECLQRKPRGFRGTSSLSALVNSISEDNGIDFVFYDCGPNIGPLNRAILLDCDFFIVPAACDEFSVRALSTLGKTLETWVRDWDTIVKLAPDGVQLLPGKPKFLGYIIQRFRVYRGQVSAGHASYLPKIERNVHSEIVRKLRGIRPELASASVAENKLGQVKDFGSAVAVSQTQGLAISDVKEVSTQQRQEASTVFGSIATKIIQRTFK